MELLRVDLNTLLRSIYPGLVFAGFLYLQRNELTILGDEPLIYIVIVLAFGIPFYAFYRAILYQRVVRRIEKLFGIPQLKFHRDIVREIDVADNKKMMSLDVAEACRSQFISTIPSTEFKTSISVFNAFTHVLLVSGWLCLLLFSLGRAWMDSVQWWDAAQWVILASCPVLLISGICFDHYEADLRETVLLCCDKERYKEIVEKYHKSYFLLSSKESTGVSCRSLYGKRDGRR